MRAAGLLPICAVVQNAFLMRRIRVDVFAKCHDLELSSHLVGLALGLTGNLVSLALGLTCHLISLALGFSLCLRHGLLGLLRGLLCSSRQLVRGARATG